MAFDLTAEQRNGMAELGERIGARFGEVTDAGDRANWRAAGELGLLGLCIPQEHGGSGLGALDTALALEAFGAACPDTGFAFAACAHLLACTLPIATFGNDQLRKEMLPDLCSGRAIAANAMTEEGAGSDSSALDTRAELGEGGYRLTGEKSFASNAPVADVVVTYAVTDPAAGFLGVSAFAVPTALAGVSRGEPFVKMGLTSCSAGTVSFDAVELAAHHTLGEPGQGAAIFQHSMLWERGCLFAIYLGMMRRQLEATVRHTSERRQFGKRLADFQAVSHRVVDMVQRLDSARLLLYRACSLIDSGRPAEYAVAQSKLAVSEAAVANSIDAVQLFGGRGYLHSGGVEQQLRDSIPATLFSGTSEIQRELIAQGVGL
ncbi:acyl-CoA dehydrogenase family protein [Jatrophihabitans sp.]|jgi:clorobiocin biosynthesis protein CloN3|uniref:acyl-CoA dehydrogenase family protein n=1 Tax=Jatrophihabitans sp. TaxID=1932789 RepID=UPI002F0261F9